MKKKILKILKILQIFISIITFSLIFFSLRDNELNLVLPNAIQFLPFIFYGIYLIFFAFEFFISKSNFRLLINYFEIVFILSSFININIETISLIIMIFSIFNAIIVVASYIKDSKENDVKTLPISYFNEIHLYTVYGTLAFLTTIGIFCWALFEKFEINKAYILLFIPIIIIVMFIVMIELNPFNRACNYINNKLDYDTFNLKLDKLMANNLHTETRSYLEITRANYMLLNDKKEALKYYKDVTPVKNKVFMSSYLMIKANFAIIKKNRAEFDEAYNILMLNSRNKKMLFDLDLRWKIENTKDEIENIENILNAKERYLLSTIINKELLLIYYISRDKLDLARNLALELKDCPLNEIKKLALDFLEIKYEE